ncbi:MAG: spore coat protein CotJB [Eubacteriales bacterium]|nr:spore coat protein CotJB [Eubacteriales bacterium]
MPQNELLNKISQLQFVCVELNLYLDTNPTDMAAKNDYLCYGEALKTAISEYETLYGPLMNFGHSPTDTGCYVNDAWPWD